MISGDDTLTGLSDKSIVNDILASGKATVEVLKSDAKWFGVTYKEDKEIVQKAISGLKNNKVYPKNLW